MAVNEEYVEEFEEKAKENIQEAINVVINKQSELIDTITKMQGRLGQEQVNFDTSEKTLNNKLVELSNMFRKAGISMFSQELEGYDTLSTSFLGEAIIADLISKVTGAVNKLEEYDKKNRDIIKNKIESTLAIQNVTPIRRLFLRIRAFFVPTKSKDLSLKQEKDTLNGVLQEYTKIDSEIENYNLEDNIIPALVKKIAAPIKCGNFTTKRRFSAFTLPGLLEESVIPDLKKLGLEHLTPKLQEALVQEYKKDLPEPEICSVSEEDMHLLVPDFSKTSNELSEQSRNERIQAILRDAKADSEKINGALRDIQEKYGGLELENFEKIDSSTTAKEREEVIEAIGNELSAKRPQEEKSAEVEQTNSSDREEESK